MKKSLSLILSIALVFSMFSSLAFAADQSIGEKLKAAGVISGNSSGDLMEDQVWKREDLAVLAIKLLGQVEEAQAAGNTHEFEDVDNPYYDGFISYAKEAGIFLGVSETQFGMNRGITAKQFAAVILRLLGFEFDYDTETEDLAVEHGLFDEDTNWLQPALRGDLYAALGAGIQVVGADGQTIAEKRNYVGFYEVSEAATKVVSASVVGAKKVAVTFDGSAKGATFALKKGAMVAAIDDVELNENGKVATLTTVDALSQGTYTVTVSGIELTVNSVDFVATNETITSIELNGEVLPISTATKVDYVVKNQYGEKMDVKPGQLTWVYSNALVKGANTADDAKVDLSDSNIKADTYLTITVVANNGIQASKTYKIGEPAVVTTIALTELVLDDEDAVRLTSGGTATIKYDARDQYGNAITELTMLGKATSTSTEDVVRLIINSALVTVGWGVDGDGKAQIEVKAGANSTSLLADETVVVTAVTPAGNSNGITFQAFKAPTIDTVTVGAPSSVVADKDGVVYLDITAADQFGTTLSAKQLAQIYTDSPSANRAIKAYAAGLVTFDSVTVVTSGEHIGKLKLDNVNGTGRVTLTVVSATGKNSSISFDVQPERYIAKVEFKNLGATKLVQGASTSTELKFLDQYGVEVTAEDAATKVSISLDKVSGDDAGLASDKSGDFANNAGIGKITLTSNATKKGEYRLTVKVLSEATPVVTYSTISQVFQVITGKSSDGHALTYEVSNVPTLYATTDTAYSESISVEAKDAAGNKVAIPSSTIDSVSSSNPALLDVSVTGDVYKAQGVGKGIAIVNVVLVTPDGAKVISNTVEVSDEAPVAKSLTAKNDQVTLTASSAQVDLFAGDFEVAITDQYNKKALTQKSGEVTFVVVKDGTTSVTTVTNGKYVFATTGDYTVTAYTKNGLTKVIKVKAVEAN